jgi:hypothetical protein
MHGSVALTLMGIAEKLPILAVKYDVTKRCDD